MVGWDGLTQFLGMGGSLFYVWLRGSDNPILGACVNLFSFLHKKSSSQPHGAKRHHCCATPMDPSGITAMLHAVCGSSLTCHHTVRPYHVELEDEDTHARLGCPCEFRSSWARDLWARRRRGAGELGTYELTGGGFPRAARWSAYPPTPLVECWPPTHCEMDEDAVQRRRAHVVVFSGWGCPASEGNIPPWGRSCPKSPQNQTPSNWESTHPIPSSPPTKHIDLLV